jgi:hypothetical protein
VSSHPLVARLGVFTGRVLAPAFGRDFQELRRQLGTAGILWGGADFHMPRRFPKPEAMQAELELLDVTPANLFLFF